MGSRISEMRFVRCASVVLSVCHLYFVSSDKDPQSFLLNGTESDLSKVVSLSTNLTELLAPSKVNSQFHNNIHDIPSSEGNLQHIFYIPKCCPHSFIIKEGTCQRYERSDLVSKMEVKIVRQVQNFISDSPDVKLQLRHQDNNTVQCGFSQSNALKQIYYTNTSFIKPRFRTDFKEVALFLHYYERNYWDLEYNVLRFCVDMQYIKTEGVILYDEHVFYCLNPSPVSKHYPVLHYISAVGLVLTFVMYFLTPSKGDSSFAQW